MLREYMLNLHMRLTCPRALFGSLCVEMTGFSLNPTLLMIAIMACTEVHAGGFEHTLLCQRREN